MHMRDRQHHNTLGGALIHGNSAPGIGLPSLPTHMPNVSQYGAQGIAAGFVAVIVIAYIFQWCVKNYRKATKVGLSINIDEPNS